MQAAWLWSTSRMTPTWDGTFIDRNRRELLEPSERTSRRFMVGLFLTFGLVLELGQASPQFNVSLLEILCNAYGPLVE